MRKIAGICHSHVWQVVYMTSLLAGRVERRDDFNVINKATDHDLADLPPWFGLGEQEH